MPPETDAPMSPAESASRYIAERVQRAAGHRWLQGPLEPALSLPAEKISPSVRLFAERRLHRVPSAVARALVAWARGERRVDLLFHVPTPRDVLAFQARGWRCVSLLDDQTPTHPHKDGLAFVLHDLCHLEKFADPEHHDAQVGFFALLHEAMAKPQWAELEAPFDDLWTAERDHVIADMNGSAVFLLLALKAKLKMAVRRRIAFEQGDESAAFKPASPAARRACDEALESMLGLLKIQGSVADAARALSEKGGAPEAEIKIHRHLEALGAAITARGSTGEASLLVSTPLAFDPI